MKKTLLAAALAVLMGISNLAIAAPKSSFSGSGTYKVGSQIAANIYVSANKASQNCYWERLSGFSGSLDDIIANDFGKGQVIVQVLKTDKGFKASRCAKFVKAGKFKTLKSIPSEGIYQVGQQVIPGTYQSKATSGNCYWARLSNFQGVLDSVIANDFSSGQQIVEISRTDKGFETSGCGGWTKIG